MASVVGQLYVEISADTSKLDSGVKDAQREIADLNKKIQESNKKTLDTFSRVGTGLTVGLTVPLAAAGTAALKYASDLEETQSKVDVVFGESAETVKSWAETSVQQMGLASETAMSAAATYGNMADGMGLASETGLEMAMSLTQLSADLASFNNTSQETAQIALASVFTGETETLKQYGIVMTETNLEQFAMQQGITKTVQEMTQAEKVQLRYNYVLANTANAQGDFARTSDSVANQTRMAQEQLKQAAATLGQNLAPMAAKALSGINDLLQGFNSLSGSQQKFILGIAGIAAAAGPVIKIGTTAVKGFQALNNAMKSMQLNRIAREIKNFGTSTTAASRGIDLITVNMQKADGAFYSVNEVLQHNTLAFEKMGISSDQAAKILAATATSSQSAGAGLAGTGAAATAATPAVKGFGITLQSALGIIGLVGAGVSLLISLFQGLGDESNEAAEQIEESSEKMVAANDEIISSAQDSAIEYEKTSAEIQQTAEDTDKLIDRYFELAGQTEKTEDEQKEMRDTAAQLVDQYEGLNGAVDENTGLFNINENAIRDIVDAHNDYQAAVAASERETELFNEAQGASAQVKVANKALEEQRTELAAVNMLLEINRVKFDHLGQAMNNAARTGAEGAEDLQKEYLKTGELITDLEGRQGAYNDAIADQEESIAGLSEEAQKLQREYQAQAEVTQYLAQQSADSYIQMMETGQEFTDTDMENMRNLIDMGVELSDAEKERFNIMYQTRQAEIESIKEGNAVITEEDIKLIEEKRATGEELTEIEQAKYDKFKEFQDMMVEAATNSTERIVLSEQQGFKERAKIQSDNLETMQEFKDNYTYMMSQLPAEGQRFLQTLGEQDARFLDEMVDLWKGGGKEKVQEYIDSWTEGINIGMPGVEDAAEEGIQGVIDAQDSVAEQYTGNAAEHIAVQNQQKMQEAGEELKTTVETNVQTAYDAMEQKIKDLNFSGFGKQICDDVADGLEDGVGTVSRAASRMASAIKSSMHVRGTVSATMAGNQANINVRWYDQGGIFNNPQIIGIAERRPEFVGAAADLENFIDKAVRESVANINPAIYRGVDFNRFGQVSSSQSVNINVPVQMMVSKSLTDADIARSAKSITRVVSRELGRLVG